MAAYIGLLPSISEQAFVAAKISFETYINQVCGSLGIKRSKARRQFRDQWKLNFNTTTPFEIIIYNIDKTKGFIFNIDIVDILNTL